MVTEPKKRIISAVPFRDRVTQHAINHIIEPLYDKRFYYHSYACRKGKGTHNASDTLYKWVRNLSFDDDAPLYALKADIKSYFASIDHSRLKAVLRRTIKDDDTLWLLDLIIDSGSETARGIPVGNLTSQLFANIYLDVLDKYIKQTLHVKYYIRYMDDFIILSHDKQELWRLLREIEAFLYNEMDLLLNPKTAILCAKNGVDFCGYRHFKDHRRVRKRSVRNMRNKVRAFHNQKIDKVTFDRSFQSWTGHIGHADAFRLRERMIKRIVSDL
jgi:retron-type reverse transcriptase